MRKYLATFGLIFSLAFVVASTTRIDSPLLVGLGNSGTKEIDFDTGSGSSNAKIVSTANTDLTLKVNGTTRVTADTNGVTTTGANRGANGSVGSPTYSFTSDTNTGVYRAGSSTLGVAAGGVATLLANGSSAEFADGSVGSPSMTFQNNTDLGFYRAGSESIGASVNGAIVTRWNNNGFQLSNGSTSFPILNFINSSTTGLYRAGADDIGIAVAGSNQANINSSGLKVNGAIELNGAGAFKVATYSGTLTNTACASFSPGIILGAYGYQFITASPSGNGGVIEDVHSSASVIVFSGTSLCGSSDNSTVILQNQSGGTRTYKLVIFYQ